MTSSFLQFVVGEGFQGVRFDMSRAQVAERLGPPPSWLGMRGIGPRVSSPDRAGVWHYCGGALVIAFGANGRVAMLGIFVDEVKRSGPFSDWPPIEKWTKADAMAWASGTGLAYVDRSDLDYICIERRCVISPRVTVPVPSGQGELYFIDCFRHAADAEASMLTGASPMVEIPDAE